PLSDRSLASAAAFLGSPLVGGHYVCPFFAGVARRPSACPRRRVFIERSALLPAPVGEARWTHPFTVLSGLPSSAAISCSEFPCARSVRASRFLARYQAWRHSSPQKSASARWPVPLTWAKRIVAWQTWQLTVAVWSWQTSRANWSHSAP